MGVSVQQLSPSQNEAYSVCIPTSELVQGALWLEDAWHGWVRPERFLSEQKRALTSCMAWYPGIYRQMVECTSGIVLDFLTDSQNLALEMRVDAEPRATYNVRKLMPMDIEENLPPIDGIEVFVDGKLAREIAFDSDAQELVLEIDTAPQSIKKAKKAASKPVQLVFPGFSEEHHIRVYLPNTRGCELGFVRGDGTYINACEKHSQIFVLGDSVAQGFSSAKPAAVWPAILADKLNMELINQSVGGQVFQPTSLVGLGGHKDALNPQLVIVALGANYRWGRCSQDLVRREIRQYLREVDSLWPEAKLVIALPDTVSHEPVKNSCYRDIPRIITEEARALQDLRRREGRQHLLSFEMPVLQKEQIADSDGHPTVEGHTFLAKYISDKLQAFQCECFTTLGQYGRCGRCHASGPATSVSKLDSNTNEPIWITEKIAFED